MIAWLMFIALGVIWGSSFLLIKIGVRELDALSLVAARLGIAAVGFVILFVLNRTQLPRDRRTLLTILVVGVLNTALPFVLITWGEQYIDSGLASVLNATTPLFSLVIAHLALHDDKITMGKLLGLVTGFFGVVVLATRSLGSGGGESQNAFLGELAVLLAAFCYGLSAVLIRRYVRNTEPMMVAGGTLIVGGVLMSLLVLFTVHPLPDVSKLSSDVLWGVLILGVLNTFIAYLMYFRLLKQWGASRATMVTYLTPPIGIFLGIVVGSEAFDPRLILGAGLIVGGVALANLSRINQGMTRLIQRQRTA